MVSLFWSRFMEGQRAGRAPDRDQSVMEPFPLDPSPFRHTEVVCIDLKRRCLYPWGTQTADEPMFWRRTDVDMFRKSYLYIKHLQDVVEDRIEHPLSQAEWWSTIGPAALDDHVNHADGCYPVEIPHPPSRGHHWSIVCFHIVDKSLWHMDGNLNYTMEWKYDTTENREKIRSYIAMLVKEWENHHYVRTPLEMNDPNWNSDRDH